MSDDATKEPELSGGAADASAEGTAVFESLEEAQAYLAAENAKVKESGKGKERVLWDIKFQDVVKYYGVSPVSSKAIAAAARAAGITAERHDKRPTGLPKVVLSRAASMTPEEIAQLRAYLDQLEGKDTPPPVEEETPKKKKGK